MSVLGFWCERLKIKNIVNNSRYCRNTIDPHTERHNIITIHATRRKQRTHDITNCKDRLQAYDSVCRMCRNCNGSRRLKTNLFSFVNARVRAHACACGCVCVSSIWLQGSTTRTTCAGIQRSLCGRRKHLWFANS